MSQKPRPRIDKQTYPKGKEARFTFDLGTIAFGKKEEPRPSKLFKRLKKEYLKNDDKFALRYK